MMKHASLALLSPLLAAGMLAAAGCADAPTANEPGVSGKPSLQDASLTCQAATEGTLTLRVMAGQDSLSGFTVQWISEPEHDSTGTWDSAATATFVAPNFALAPGSSINVTFGDPFLLLGATGDTTDLLCGTTYHFRLITADTAGALDTGDIVSCTTAPCDTSGGGQDTTDVTGECPKGMGWWKNHLDEWPVDSLTVGGVTYTKDQLVRILSSPVRGSKLLIIARKLIVAKLNVELTGDTTSAVLNAIASLDSAIGNAVIPPIGNGKLNLNGRVNAWTELLEEYNEGNLPGHDCDDEDDDDDDDDNGGGGRGPGNNNGQGHAYGHDKNWKANR